jgi:hypothetical protein
MPSIRFGGSDSSKLITPVEAKVYSSNILNMKAYKQSVRGIDLKRDLVLKNPKPVSERISISQGRSRIDSCLRSSSETVSYNNIYLL